MAERVRGRFNGRKREDLLNETKLRNLPQARGLVAAWATDDNTERPHSASDDPTPADHPRP